MLPFHNPCDWHTDILYILAHLCRKKSPNLLECYSRQPWCGVIESRNLAVVILLAIHWSSYNFVALLVVLLTRTPFRPLLRIRGSMGSTKESASGRSKSDESDSSGEVLSTLHKSEVGVVAPHLRTGFTDILPSSATTLFNDTVKNDFACCFFDVHLLEGDGAFTGRIGFDRWFHSIDCEGQPRKVIQGIRRGRTAQFAQGIEKCRRFWPSRLPLVNIRQGCGYPRAMSVKSIRLSE